MDRLAKLHEIFVACFRTERCLQEIIGDCVGYHEGGGADDQNSALPIEIILVDDRGGGEFGVRGR